jgi:thiamine pyrophosphate-dependent acetolactate synthase large subunit-like protein
LAFSKSIDCDLSDIDYSQVARSLNCQGERVENPVGICGALERALSASGPYLIDIVIDRNSIPPISMFDGFDQVKH